MDDFQVCTIQNLNWNFRVFATRRLFPKDRRHVMCGNRLAIKREESFKKFASFEEELLLCLCLLGSSKILDDLIWRKCLKLDKMKIF